MRTFVRKASSGGKQKFSRRLLAWFHRRQRDLPWRRTRDPYRIWISEVMLQQTRVAAVLPYYRRFIRRFPTVRALARGRTEEVLRYWSGLGYYSRARNLRRAAKQMVARHKAEFPRTRGEALRLPGIGAYTAAAILSIAYGEPLAVLDGNVARVLARLDGVRGDVRAAGRWQKLQAQAQELMNMPCRRCADVTGGVAPPTSRALARSKEGRFGPSPSASACGSAVGASRRPRTTAGLKPRPSNAAGFGGLAGEWNQAMMELGATVCTPRAPRCVACPVSRWCRAYKLGLTEEIPARRQKRAPVKVKIAAAVLIDPRGRTVLVRQNEGLDGALFSGLWQFPALQVERNGAGNLARRLERRLGWASEEMKRAKVLPGVRHSVTYRDVTLLPVLVRVEKLPKVEGSRTVPLVEVDRLPISNATRKIAARCLTGTRQAQRIRQDARMKMAGPGARRKREPQPNDVCRIE